MAVALGPKQYPSVTACQPAPEPFLEDTGVALGEQLLPLAPAAELSTGPIAGCK